MLHPNYLAHVADDAVSVLEEFISSIKSSQATRFQEALLNNQSLANIIKSKKTDDVQLLLNTNKKLSASISSTMQSVLDVSRDNLIAQITKGAQDTSILKRYEQYSSLLNSTNLHTAQSSLNGLVRYANRQNIAMSNLAHTQWMSAVDTYVTKVNLQLMSIEDAVRTGLKDLAAQNLEWVDYASGHKDRADVALRRVLRTEANQTGARITENYLDILNIDLVETSAHMGARPEHFIWQGQVFSRTGSHGYPDFYEATGYGTVTGLCGANCRHSFGPYFEEAGPTDWGININADENERIYNLTQKQRALERNVRAKKHALYAAMPEQIAAAKLEVGLAQKQVREFVKSNPELTREYWREWAHNPKTQTASNNISINGPFWNEKTKKAPSNSMDGSNIDLCLKGSNPHFDGENWYSYNCQRSVVAYEMRRRGFAVTSLPSFENDKLGYHHAYLKSFSKAKFKKVKRQDPLLGISELVRDDPVGSRYFVEVVWDDGLNTGHVFVCEKKTNGLQFSNPQDPSDHRYGDASIFEFVKQGEIRVCRVDNREYNDLVWECIKDE